MTYGIPYTVRGWGDEIVTTVAVDDERERVEGYTHVVRSTVPGPVILVPTSALTPVDTTPPEPEPGVYFIGDDGEAWQHFADRADEQRWCVVGYMPILTWRQVWAKVGGSGITPRRLVPEPAPVELPWRCKDETGEVVEVQPPDDDHQIPITCHGIGTVYHSPENAEEMAVALISAARAAREATP